MTRTSLALALATLLLAACSGSDTGSGGTEAATEAAVTEAAATEPAATEAAATDAATEAAAGAATVATADTDLGTVLVDGEGRSLYLFTNDTGTTSTCTGDCAGNWPALLTEGDPVGEGGADAALLSTSEREDGGIQVTYNGHPLYFFSGDEAPGDLNGQEVGDVWYLVTPAGEAVEGEEAAVVDDGY